MSTSLNYMLATASGVTSGFTWGYAATVLMVVLFLVACVLLILTVLIQKPQGGGLAGAFGSGAGSGQTAFGTRTGDALTVATIIMFIFYLATAIGLSYLIRPGGPAPAPEVVSQPGTTPADTAPADGGAATTPAQPPATQPETNAPQPAPAPAPADQPVTPPATPPSEPATPTPTPAPVTPPE